MQLSWARVDPKTCQREDRMPDRMPEIMSEYMPMTGSVRRGCCKRPGPLKCRKRAADVIAIVALYSSCCLVALGIRSVCLKCHTVGIIFWAILPNVSPKMFQCNAHIMARPFDPPSGSFLFAAWPCGESVVWVFRHEEDATERI